MEAERNGTKSRGNRTERERTKNKREPNEAKNARSSRRARWCLTTSDRGAGGPQIKDRTHTRNETARVLFLRKLGRVVAHAHRLGRELGAAAARRGRHGVADCDLAHAEVAHLRGTSRKSTRRHVITSTSAAVERTAARRRASRGGRRLDQRLSPPRPPGESPPPLRDEPRATRRGRDSGRWEDAAHARPSLDRFGRTRRTPPLERGGARKRGSSAIDSNPTVDRIP